MRPLLILASLLLLAACKPEDYAVLDQAVGHDPLGNAPKLLAISSSVEALVASSASSVPPMVETPVVVSSGSSVYVPPLTEACLPGEKLFRVWDCGPDGRRIYW